MKSYLDKGHGKDLIKKVKIKKNKFNHSQEIQPDSGKNRKPRYITHFWGRLFQSYRRGGFCRKGTKF